MHLLPCPNCQTPISVAPAQAGDQTNCPSCDHLVAIPKLGELRNLPQADRNDEFARGETTVRDVSLGRRSAFLVLGLVAIASLVIATYSGIRWSQIDVPITTEEHLAGFTERYREVAPAHMIREYEDMDQYDISLVQPYIYKKIELEKRAWGRNTMIAGTVAGLTILAALLVITTGQNKRPRALTDT